jgi:hypothetical protein
MNPIYDFYHFEFTNGQKAWIRRDQIIAIIPLDPHDNAPHCLIIVQYEFEVPKSRHAQYTFEVKGETADAVISRLANGVYHRRAPDDENAQRLDQILPPLHKPEPNPLQSFPTP